MSQLLKNLATYVRAMPERDVHVVLGQGLPNEEPVMLSAAEPTQAQADLEGRSIDGVAVGDPAPGRLAYFMDGMQRPRGPIYLNSPVPIMYGYTAATIRARGSDRRMRKHDHKPLEALYYPVGAPEAPALSGIECVDTADGDGSVEEHPLMLVERAKNKIGDIRARTEAEITSKWLQDFQGRDEWLLVDGSLSGNYNQYEAPNIVGVIKSHQTQYFPRDEQRKILGLKVGERSGVFIPIGRKRQQVYSWYVRLRPNEGLDMYFGLVRVEAAKCERTLEMADEISRWLLAERSPLSMPDARWDRLIYPIHDCELYLKSLAPSQTVLDALMISLANL